MKSFIFLLFFIFVKAEHVIDQNKFPEIWSSPEKLQSNYDLIAEIRVLLDEIIENESEWLDSGFDSWPRPNPFYYRTPDCIYLEFDKDSMNIARLWTPFGEVKLLGSGWLDAIRRVSMKFMERIDTITELKDISTEMNWYYWADGKEYPTVYTAGKVFDLCSREFPELCTNKIYKISPRDAPSSCSNKGFIEIIGVDYTNDRNSFEKVSKGKNAFQKKLVHEKHEQEILIPCFRKGHMCNIK